jgi:hypothetical protein
MCRPTRAALGDTIRGALTPVPQIAAIVEEMLCAIMWGHTPVLTQ